MFNTLPGKLAILSLLAIPLSTPITANASSVYFSEYLEGSSFNKALEIFNHGAIAVENLQIVLYANGSSSPSATIALNGSIPPGGVFVIAGSRSNPALASLADQLSGSLNFNGDDAIGLILNGVLVDTIGQIGFDPGAGWTTDILSTLNMTLRRRPGVSSGDSNPNDDFLPNLDPLTGEWDGFSIDDFSDIGLINAPVVPLPPAVWLFASGLGLLGWIRKRHHLSKPA